MPNKSIYEERKSKYISELRAYKYVNPLYGEASIPMSNKFTDYISVEVGRLTENSYIEVESSGTVVNSSGLARTIIYQVGLSLDGKNIYAQPLQEQTTMANSGTNSSHWKYSFKGGLLKPSTYQAFRTVPAASANTQVTLSSLYVNASGLLNGVNDGIGRTINIEEASLVFQLGYSGGNLDVNYNQLIVKVFEEIPYNN